MIFFHITPYYNEEVAIIAHFLTILAIESRFYYDFYHYGT